MFFEFRYFQNKNISKDVSIKNIYFIYEDEVIEHSESINHLNDKLKYSSSISLIFLKKLIKKDCIIEIIYRKNNNDYIINFPSNTIDNFPLYTKDDNLRRNPNKIVEINCGPEERVELLSLLLKYGGPLNDFYISKNNGIPLNRIYSHKLNKFPFKKTRYNMEDSFLNEYEIDSEQVLKIKNNLDESKIVNDEINEKYILQRFNHFRLDGKMIFYGIVRWIFGNKKEE
jgi:hypothetical protein